MSVPPPVPNADPTPATPVPYSRRAAPREQSRIGEGGEVHGQPGATGRTLGRGEGVEVRVGGGVVTDRPGQARQHRGDRREGHAHGRAQPVRQESAREQEGAPRLGRQHLGHVVGRLGPQRAGAHRTGRVDQHVQARQTGEERVDVGGTGHVGGAVLHGGAERTEFGEEPGGRHGRAAREDQRRPPPPGEVAGERATDAAGFLR